MSFFFVKASHAVHLIINGIRLEIYANRLAVDDSIHSFGVTPVRFFILGNVNPSVARSLFGPIHGEAYDQLLKPPRE